MEWQCDGYWVVTGATGGIGQAICHELVANGCKVIATCRDLERGERLAAQLRRAASGGAEVRCELLRLDDCASIRDFAMRIARVRIASLVNNAGVICRHYGLAGNGIEQTMAVNCIGTVMLTRLLLPMVADGGSVVFTTSVTRRLHHLSPDILVPTARDFSQLGTYGRSKLALTHYAMHLADELAGHVRVNCADPGVVNSGIITMHRWFDPIANVLFRPLISSPQRGAQSALCAATSPYSGMIYHHAHYHPIDKELRRDAAHRRLVAAIDAWLARFL